MLLLPVVVFLEKLVHHAIFLAPLRVENDVFVPHTFHAVVVVVVLSISEVGFVEDQALVLQAFPRALPELEMVHQTLHLLPAVALIPKLDFSFVRGSLPIFSLPM